MTAPFTVKVSGFPTSWVKVRTASNLRDSRKQPEARP